MSTLWTKYLQTTFQQFGSYPWTIVPLWDPGRNLWTLVELKTKKGPFVVCTQVASLPTVVLATDLGFFCKQYIHQGPGRSHTYLLWVAGPPTLVWLLTLCQPVIWLQSLSPEEQVWSCQPRNLLGVMPPCICSSSHMIWLLSRATTVPEQSHHLNTQPEKVFTSQTTPTSVRT